MARIAVGVVIWTALAARVWCSEPATTTTVTVRDAAGLRQALAKAQPGTRILLEPGEYPGGFSFANLRGEPGRPIVVAAADPRNPPVFKSGGAGMHLADAAYLELHDLTVSGWSANGLNIDDGGSYDTPAHHIVLRGLRVIGSAPPGNRDGIKLSGVDDFRVEGCTIEGWGTGGGSAIDMVGCHRGLIEGCTFRHTDAPGSTGVQAKGGSSDVVVRRNRFENAGGRAVNIGGSTGLAYFRPRFGRARDRLRATAKRKTFESKATCSSADWRPWLLWDATGRLCASTRSIGRGAGRCGFCRRRASRALCRRATPSSRIISLRFDQMRCSRR